MAVKNALKIFNILKMIAIISFVVTFGSCVACNSSMKTDYGPEEYYQKPNGGVGYGANSYTSGTHPYDFIAVISGIVFIISGLGAGIYHDDAKIEEQSLKGGR